MCGGRGLERTLWQTRSTQNKSTLGEISPHHRCVSAVDRWHRSPSPTGIINGLLTQLSATSTVAHFFTGAFFCACVFSVFTACEGVNSPRGFASLRARVQRWYFWKKANWRDTTWQDGARPRRAASGKLFYLCERCVSMRLVFMRVREKKKVILCKSLKPNLNTFYQMFPTPPGLHFLKTAGKRKKPKQTFSVIRIEQPPALFGCQVSKRLLVRTRDISLFQSCLTSCPQDLLSGCDENFPSTIRTIAKHRMAALSCARESCASVVRRSDVTARPVHTLRRHLSVTDVCFRKGQ